MVILGLSCFYHDSAACLVRDGEIVAAAQEERFTRKKHDERFPSAAVAYCLKEAGLTLSDVDIVAYYEKNLMKFDRILQTAVAMAPRGFGVMLQALPLWLRKRLWIERALSEALPGFKGKFIFPTHHESHAASAFYPSPFQRAAVLTLDAVGEWNSTTYGIGEGNRLTLQKGMNFPHSLGMLYSAFTYYTGFKVNSGEYKLMGLAPYGAPTYASIILEKLVDVKEDGSFRLNMDYFGYCDSLVMTNAKFDALFGGRARKSDEPLEQRHMDLAASIQEVTNAIVLQIAAHVVKETGERRLCMAGGVALNCVANGLLLKSGIVDDVWVQPAAGDAGGALGAALYAWHQHLEQPRQPQAPDGMRGAYLGPAFADEEIEAALKRLGARYERLDEAALIERTADLLANGRIVGWFQGRMEYGPRALGARSILGDPRSPAMQRDMNLKIKFRESFRPFAPSVMEEHVGEWFEHGVRSPYMLFTFPVHPKHRKAVAPEDAARAGIDRLKVLRSEVPAITHVDDSARIQTVDGQTNPRYHKLIERFYQKTGVPMLINTSFNVRGEPIVCTPEDAWRCFMGTHIDHLAIGNFLVSRTQDDIPEELLAWRQSIAAD